MRVFFLLAGLVCAIASSRAETHDFEAAAKVFAKHCLDCHSADDPEGKFVLDSYQQLMNGGESGAAIIPGKSKESLLVKMVEGKFEKEGKVRFMPPGKREKLTSEELAIVRGWIDDGAKAPAAGAVVAKEIVVPKIAPKIPPRRSINSVAYDPKAKLLAVGRASEVEIFSAESQSLIRTLPIPEGNTTVVAFSGDGKYVFAAGGRSGIAGEIKVWTVADGVLVRSISGHTDTIYALAVSPDGKLLASGGYDQKIKIWNAETGSEIRTLTGHNGCVYGLAFRPDGKLLASASGDRTVKLWDVETGARRDTLSQPLKEQYTVAFSPDGKHLAAGGVDNRIRVWEISEEAKETTNPLIHSKFAHEGAILKVAFATDGKLLVSSAEDRTVKIWDAEKMEQRRALEAQMEWVPALAFALENKAIAVGRLDGSLGFYNSADGKILPPPRPEIARIEPRVAQRGVATKLKVMGKNLGSVSAVRFNNKSITGELAPDSSPTAGEVWISVKPEETVSRGMYDLQLAGSNGESSAAKLYIDDIPQLVETEGKAQKFETLPAAVWGLHETGGDKDSYEFSVKAGETLVFDASGRVLGSKADLVLSIEDESGKVLATNNHFDKSGDPLLAYTFTESGTYRLVVSELLGAGSPEHFYRVSVGASPFVTAVYPPVIPKGEKAELELVGFNLADKAKHAIESSSGSESVVSLDPEKFRWRGDFKVSVTDNAFVSEGESDSSATTPTGMAVPAVAAGRLTSGDGEDWFRFEAKAGQRWIIETAADRINSPLDTRIEVRNSDGSPVPRILLQAVRDSAVTFRGIDSVTTDCRVENWEEMELNQFLYLQGEVVRLFREPQGPDSGFNFYSMNGRRRNYFDTTATAHANAEPCYIVEPHPIGTKPVPNGLPVFQVNFENDDDSERRLGTDSKVYFQAPADGSYLVRVTDSRGFHGDRFLYTLTIREEQPDFRISIEGANPTIPKGSGQRFVLNVDRIDGFEGEIKVEISGLPSGFTVSNPIVIQEGHTAAFGTIFATPEAMSPGSDASASKLIATAQIQGKTVTREVGTLGKITLGESAPLFVELDPIGTSIPEISVAPGGVVPAMIKVRRNGHNELVTFQLENLPHGVIVDNIGLNGVLIPKDQNEREIFITAAKWVPETDRLCYAVSNEAGRQTSRPVLIKVRRTSGQVANR